MIGSIDWHPIFAIDLGDLLGERFGFRLFFPLRRSSTQRSSLSAVDVDTNAMVTVKTLEKHDAGERQIESQTNKKAKVGRRRRK